MDVIFINVDHSKHFTQKFRKLYVSNDAFVNINKIRYSGKQMVGVYFDIENI